MTLNEIIALDKKYREYLWRQITSLLYQGEGMKLWDKDGKVYYDFLRHRSKCAWPFSSCIG